VTERELETALAAKDAEIERLKDELHESRRVACKRLDEHVKYTTSALREREAKIAELRRDLEYQTEARSSTGSQEDK
jgi:uncharacterized coiled-coil protein SlyX